ncbi:MAG: hypothetical protein Q7S28_03650, partial [bacterium]|nr:hypothetical protein [bacterium]
VTALNFTKRANPPGHDQISIAFTMQYNVNNALQRFVQSLQTSVARVSAATFDSNVVPSSTATYKLGVTGQIWTSVNDLINFNGTNVGIGTGMTSANAKLELDGGLLINKNDTASSTCSATYRGTLWFDQVGGTAEADRLSVCLLNASDTYEWVQIY